MITLISEETKIFCAFCPYGTEMLQTGDKQTERQVLRTTKVHEADTLQSHAMRLNPSATRNCTKPPFFSEHCYKVPYGDENINANVTKVYKNKVKQSGEVGKRQKGQRN